MAERPSNIDFQLATKKEQGGAGERSERHVVRGTLRGGDAPLVIDLRGGDVLVPKQVLHLPDVFACIQQEGGHRRP